jgi:hypothetical protein
MRHFSTIAVRAGALVLAIWPLLSAAAHAADAPKPLQKEKPADCELILKGSRIEKLLLIDEREKLIELVRPGDRVLLPAGYYKIQQIDVQGGWSSWWTFKTEASHPNLYLPTPENRLLLLSPDKPCRPNMGMPLVPEISARRVGRLIKVNCAGWMLYDGDGRMYTKLNGISPPPRFAVFQGDRDITASGAGSLEFG